MLFSLNFHFSVGMIYYIIMKFSVKLSGKTLYNTMRQAGYAPALTKTSASKPGNELVFYRSLSGQDFPKFHIYAAAADGIASLNIHLDQKKPSYSGSHAHAGEYEGDLIETEVARIQAKSAP
jgi:hypothetical protein